MYKMENLIIFVLFLVTVPVLLSFNFLQHNENISDSTWVTHGACSRKTLQSEVLSFSTLALLL